jgi:dephospho-CoA kinase
MTPKIKQKRIGLTGGIGSGKTFVSDVFKKLEIPVFNADYEAKRCMVENERLQQEIQNVFGDEVYNNGALQKEVLAEIVFKDKQKLEKLNKLVHPVVKQSFETWCAEQTSKIVIKEAAILFESDSHLTLDKVICVSAPEETRIERVIKRDNISREQVMARIERQMSQHEKEKLSDFVIINDEKELLLPQIIKIITQIS